MGNVPAPFINNTPVDLFVDCSGALGLQDCNLLVQLSGNTFDELQTVLPYLCALHTTLCCAMAGGKPYAVSVKYCSESGHHIAQVTPLVDVNDPRLANKQQGYSASVFYVETILNILLQNLHVALS